MNFISIGSNLCGALLDNGRDCPSQVDPEAPINLCPDHLMVAYNWVRREHGSIQALMPAPCVLCGQLVGEEFSNGWLCSHCGWRVGEVLDAATIASWNAPRQVDVVYYIRFGDRIKIGTSRNPKIRLGTLPHDEVLAFERGDRRLEQRRHHQFAEHRIAGTEWFHVHDALTEHVRMLRAGVEDPWKQHAFWVTRENSAHAS
jgi:hypothetical protein